MGKEWQSVVDCAFTVLKEKGKPMSAGAIMKCMVRDEMYFFRETAASPTTKVYASLHGEMRRLGEKSRFALTASGRWKLKE